MSDDVYDEYETDTAFLKDHAISFDGHHVLLPVRGYVSLTRRFGSKDALLAFLRDGGDITDVDGIGETSALRIWKWAREEYGIDDECRRCGGTGEIIKTVFGHQGMVACPSCGGGRDE